MPGQNTQQSYNLKPLLPFIESGFVLITPNSRLARRIKAAWDTQQATGGKTVWESLEVFPIEPWLLNRWRDCVRLELVEDRVLLTDSQSLELWRQVIEDAQLASGDYTLLQTSVAATLANQACQRLLRWQVDTAEESVRSAFAFDQDCQRFLEWNQRFEQLLAEKGLATADMCLADLYRRASSLAGKRLLLVDIDEMPPLFRGCIDRLGAEVESVSPAGTPITCLARGYPDKRSELNGIALWASDLHQREPLARVGIVLSDMAADRQPLEFLLRRSFGCLGENYTSLPVNFSTGINLDRAPVVRDALAVLRLCLRQVSPAEVSALIGSRFLVLPDASSPAAIKLLRLLFDSGRERVEVADLRYLASEIVVGEQKGLTLGRHLMAMASMRVLRENRHPSQWLEPVYEILDTWGWPGSGPLDSLEHQQVKSWYQFLEQLAAYDEVVGPLSLDEFLALLTRLLSSQPSQPQTADSSIQVLGPLEAAGLEFDYLWLCGMQGSRWPAAPRPSPFIPHAIQRGLQMPHASAEREWEYASGLMQQYSRSTVHLLASYARAHDGTPEQPSVLLGEFEHESVAATNNRDIRWEQQRDSLHGESIIATHAPIPDSVELDTLRGGSALLEDQSQCPFRAFAKRRLGAAPLGDTVLGESAASRGSLMHRALHLLFVAVTDSNVLASLSVEGEKVLVRDCVSRAMGELPGAGPSAPPRVWCELEERRLQRLLRQWLAVERQRESFRVAETEADLILRLERLELQLRVDRIDHMLDGSTLIIDYKSGQCRLQDWLGERPAKPQLLLYNLAVDEPADGLAFAQVRTDDCGFVGVAGADLAPGIRADVSKLVRGGWDIDSWESLNELWSSRLRALAEEFLEGDARVAPQPGACDWCGLESLCRIGEQVSQ